MFRTIRMDNMKEPVDVTLAVDLPFNATVRLPKPSDKCTRLKVIS
jgi:hypothetical protein